jgi:hypothetical protein
VKKNNSNRVKVAVSSWRKVMVVETKKFKIGFKRQESPVFSGVLKAMAANNYPLG